MKAAFRLYPGILLTVWFPALRGLSLHFGVRWKYTGFGYSSFAVNEEFEVRGFSLGPLLAIAWPAFPASSHH